MNVTAIKKKAQIRGRGVGPTTLAEVRELVGEEPRRRNLPIEHLLKIPCDSGGGQGRG